MEWTMTNARKPKHGRSAGAAGGLTQKCIREAARLMLIGARRNNEAERGIRAFRDLLLDMARARRRYVKEAKRA